jgi:hypothetical protein
MEVRKENFATGDRFTVDAEMYLTGKSFRYDTSKKERKVRPVKGQIRLGLEVSQSFNIECSRWARYDYPLETIFRLNVTVCKKSNKTAFYNYFDEHYLLSDDQVVLSISEYQSIYRKQ